MVDGGILHNVPTKIARILGADKIIAVDVGYFLRKGEVTNLPGILLQAWQIRGKELSRYQDLDAEILIKVELPEVSPLDFHKQKKCISEGEKATEGKMTLIKKLSKIPK